MLLKNYGLSINLIKFNTETNLKLNGAMMNFGNYKSIQIKSVFKIFYIHQACS